MLTAVLLAVPLSISISVSTTKMVGVGGSSIIWKQSYFAVITTTFSNQVGVNEGAGESLHKLNTVKRDRLKQLICVSLFSNENKVTVRSKWPLASF